MTIEIDLSGDFGTVDDDDEVQREQYLAHVVVECARRWPDADLEIDYLPHGEVQQDRVGRRTSSDLYDEVSDALDEITETAWGRMCNGEEVE